MTKISASQINELNLLIKEKTPLGIDSIRDNLEVAFSIARHGVWLSDLNKTSHRQN